MSNFTKIRPMGAALIYTDRQADEGTDMTKVIGAFLYSTNAPKTRIWYFTIKTSGVFLSLTWHSYYTYITYVTLNVSCNTHPNRDHVS
jgi:hypothetical protein